jgi:hypothetical protein
MKKDLAVIILVIVLSILFAGCGTPPSTPQKTPTVPATETKSVPLTITTTPDPCSPPQIQENVQKVHRHMREFDDASELASHISRDQISSSIADLQRIRREAEDEIIPACLTNLKTYQLQHMNTVIQTLLTLMDGADPQSIDQAMAIGRQQHDQYVLELARVLGLTIVPATLPSGPSETPTP